MKLQLSASIKPDVGIDRFTVVATLAEIRGVELVTVVFPDSDDPTLASLLVIEVDRDLAVSAIDALNRTGLLARLDAAASRRLV